MKGKQEKLLENEETKIHETFNAEVDSDVKEEVKTKANFDYENNVHFDFGVESDFESSRNDGASVSAKTSDLLINDELSNEIIRKISMHISRTEDGSSFSAALISLCIYCLGPATFSIPNKFYKVSFGVGMVILLIAGMVARFTMGLLLIISDKYRINKYSELVKQILGKKFAKLLDGLIIVNGFGALTLYFVVIYKLLGSIVYDFSNFAGSQHEFLSKSYWSLLHTKMLVIYSIAAFVMIILVSFKKINKVAIPSLMGFIGVVGSVLIVVVQSYSYIDNYWQKVYNEADPKTWIAYLDVSKGFDANLHFFRCFAGFFFAFNYHAGLLPVCSGLKNSNNNYQTKNKILNFSILSYTSIYIVVGILGFLSYPVHTPDLIIQRQKIFDNDIVMDIAKIFIVIAAIMKIPVNFNTFKMSLYNFMFGKTEVSKRCEILTVIIIVFLESTIATFYMKIENYFDILGGIASVNISIVIPCLLFIKSKGISDSKFKKVLVFLLMLFMGSIGFTSASITIYKSIFE